MNDVQVRYANPQELDTLLDFDSRVYPKEWCVTKDFVDKAYAKNNQIYRVVEANGKIEGYYAFFPVAKDVLDGLLNGEIDESRLCDYILPYRQGTAVAVYFATIVVQQNHSQRRELAKRLLTDIPAELERIQQRGCQVEEIGAIAISEDGNRVLGKSRLEQMGSYEEEPSVFVYRGTAF